MTNRKSKLQTQSQRKAAENILRVDAERIDNVLNLVGELIIGKSMLQQALQGVRQRYPKEAIRGTLRRCYGISVPRVE